ncbi:MAG: SpoIIIAH-like family protein, partial [Clostridiales bacterium]|nr:SpoIIIAH-like family protein [Clostridiales bacterium]
MKRRINMIIGKKQIILASLTLILGIAIYLNYVFSQGAGDLVETGKLENTESNYG